MLALRRHTAVLVAVWGTLALACLLCGASRASASEFEFRAAFGPDGTSGSKFATATSVGIDEGDEVMYVLDRGADALYKFDLKGHPLNFGGAGAGISGNKLSGLAIGGASGGERQVAVNPTTHIVYLTGKEEGGSAKALQAFQANGEPAVFAATGTNEIPGSPDFFRLQGVAVDENGAIYTADGGLDGNGVQVYDESGALIVPSFVSASPLFGPGNIAVDSNGSLYVLKTGITPAKYLPSEYPVTATTTYTAAPAFNSNSARGIAVDRETDNVYVAETAPTRRVALFDSEGAPLETFGGPGQGGELKAPEGMAAASVEGRAFAFVADSPAGGSQVKIFAEGVCFCPPVIKDTNANASAVTGDSAILQAKINPGNLDTAYRFEYGLVDCVIGPCQEAPLGGGAIPAGRNDIAVQFALTGLQSETTYHFRVVAENSASGGPGPSIGSDRTFTTQTSGLGAVLSDSRAWEMVSPPKKFGGTIVSTKLTAIQASTSGEKLAYASSGSLFTDPISNRPPEPTSVLAERESGGKWADRDLTPPHEEASMSLHAPTEFKLFTPDLLRGVMEPTDNLPLSPQATERTPYVWDDGEPPSFTPLLTPANVTPGTKTSPVPGEGDRVWISGASPDLSQVAIQSIPPLIASAANESLYMWSGGELEAVSELPSSEGGAVVTAAIGTGHGSVRHAISDDGSRVFWTSSTFYNGTAIGKAGLYLRDRNTHESVRLDVKEPDASGDGDNRPAFNGASADGSVVYFTDSQRLTADASPGGRDLYRCEIGEVGGGALGCTDITDVSAPLAGSGESSEVIDQMPALSEDGSRVFFVARGVLDEGPTEQGQEAVAGEPNLYYWEEGQAPRLVASLSEEDHLVWGEVRERGYAANVSAAISPEGRYFTFTSEKSLTGYENTNASDHPTSEVFLYDSEAEEGERLACISCNPSGAMAAGERLPGKVAFFPPDPAGLWAGRWVAATLPQATQTDSERSSLYHPRTALDNGRVFFNSVDPLVAADSNGEWDVYQYEPVGVGSCSANTSTATATRSGAGCVGLLSSGSGEGDAGFLDASQSGEDVFFLTRSRLSVLDQDEEMDVYDARVNGIPAVLHPVSECAGEACQPSVGAPSDPTPASEAFKGAQSPVNCRKGQKKVRRNGKDVCIKKKQHKKHHKHHKTKPHKKPTHKSGRAGR
jgi:DNA-binding beta-propeller fold protein YncE